MPLPRVLAAGADHDVSEVRAELRAHTRTLNALGQNVADLRENVTDLRENVNDLRENVADLRGNVADLRNEMHEGFAKVNAGMSRITELLNVFNARPSLFHRSRCGAMITVW